MKKQKVVKRLLFESSLQNKGDYFKQYSILNSLLKKYPNENFWTVVSFEKKLKSLYYLKTPVGKKALKRKYNEFAYTPPAEVKYKIGEKTGKDFKPDAAPTTIRKFLSE
jgi:hypothetical protein